MSSIIFYDFACAGRYRRWKSALLRVNS